MTPQPLASTAPGGPPVGAELGTLRDHLAAWVRRCLGAQVPVLFSGPAHTQPSCPQAQAGVVLHLLRLSVPVTTRPTRQAALGLRTHWLAWACGPDNGPEAPIAADQLLCELALAAQFEPGLSLQLDPVPLDYWAAMGVPPRASIGLEAPLRREPRAPIAPPVRVPLTLTPAPMTRLHGQVLGPGGVPLAAAAVEAPALQRRARTGPDGRFVLGVPAEGPPLRLIVRARDSTAEFSVNAAEDTSAVRPLALCMPLPLPPVPTESLP